MNKYHVNIGGLTIGDEYPVRLMGVINLSSESFYKESVVTQKEDIQEIIERFEYEGADILDIGGASTAPKNLYGTPDISEDEEIQRISSAMKIITEYTTLPLSVDTTSSRVAEIALDMGAYVINDISGLKSDAEMANIVSDHDVPVILMANCKNPCQNIQAALDSIEESIKIAIGAGISHDKIIIDPGIGFGKPGEVDYAILRELDRFTELNQPVMIGISRKAFIGELLDQQDPTDRLIGSLAATSIAVYKGVNIVRTHDIKETRLAVRVGEAVRAQTEYSGCG